MADIFVYKNAIKPNYSPKWGNFGRVGNFVGIFANFSGNSGENFLATLHIMARNPSPVVGHKPPNTHHNLGLISLWANIRNA